jgi:hypothetical protein
LPARLVIIDLTGEQLLKLRLNPSPERRYLRRAALDKQRKGVGNQVVDALKIVAGGRQWHARLCRHGAVAQAPVHHRAR